MLKLGAALGLATHATALGLMLLLTLVLADLSYRFVERPLWKTRLQNVPPRQIILLSVLMMVLVMAVWRPVESWLTPPPTIHNLSPSAKARSDLPVIYSMDCDGFVGTAKLQPCTFNDVAYDKNVVLLGDSIGAQWFSAVAENFPKPEWKLTVLTKSSCAILDEEYVYRGAGGLYKVCFEWREKALRYIESKQPEVVIVGNAASYGFSDEQWREGSSRFFARLSKAAKQVYVIVGTPWLSFDGPSCIERMMEKDGTLPKDACREENTHPAPLNVERHLLDAAARFPNVHVINPAPLVCPDGMCRAMTPEGIAVYRDTQHLTDSFVRSVAPGLGRMMLSNSKEGAD
ncbi:MAG: SGNH hydrolase domain-containing protein [Halothiobacillaceae bacterium]